MGFNRLDKMKQLLGMQPKIHQTQREVKRDIYHQERKQHSGLNEVKNQFRGQADSADSVVEVEL
ncbi:Hypothetical protein PHPALM_20483 [Phytophthora palmivora]|uniref:Uncharacterized protein n=1 Tax=Phytophthora palmivora TaxID=4796 RepID=A0A2P4XER2_9STRA|nr:Hypothetical protein PHPALM_20483 [Phytophthora palmivora]